MIYFKKQNQNRKEKQMKLRMRGKKKRQARRQKENRDKQDQSRGLICVFLYECAHMSVYSQRTISGAIPQKFLPYLNFFFSLPPSSPPPLPPSSPLYLLFLLAF